MSRFRLSALQAMLLSLLLAAAAAAQSTATLVGTVSDSTGGVVPRARVTITGVDTGLVRQTQSNDSGLYVAPALPVGAYSVAVEAEGFKKKVLTGIVLQVNQEARVDIALEVGAVTESVTVSSEAPRLQTENAAVGQVIDNRYNSQIPLNGRDFSQLVLLVPGANIRPGAAR